MYLHYIHTIIIALVSLNYVSIVNRSQYMLQLTFCTPTRQSFCTFPLCEEGEVRVRERTDQRTMWFQQYPSVKDPHHTNEVSIPNHNSWLSDQLFSLSKTELHFSPLRGIQGLWCEGVSPVKKRIIIIYSDNINNNINFICQYIQKLFLHNSSRIKQGKMLQGVFP